MKEREIDCMKYRKSTHLAGVDVEAIIEEKGNCILTIKDAYYQKGVDVSGNKTDGYFLEFEEPVKGMVVNSGNRATISKISKREKNLNRVESRLISNWIGLRIELYFDETVKMMGQIVGGIKVKEFSTLTAEPKTNPTNAIAILNACKTLSELQSQYLALPTNERNHALVIAKKDELKAVLK